ncbi:MAG: molecular chaperone TorD family protein [Clostridiaceae bacterium]|nr:molecular chaperone TorD family protein [Clostridiaceae bacterium]
MLTSEESLRGLNYIMLSSLFYKKVDLETIEKSKEIIEATLLCNIADKKVAEDLVNVMNSSQAEEKISELQVEFTNMFLLPGGVSPYESIYMGEEFRLKQEPWLEVKRFYYQCGFKLDESSHLLEDHISAELNFMSYLIEERDYNFKRLFFNNHIQQWVPRLLEDVKKCTNDIFYKKVADYATAFIKSEEILLT